MLIYLLVTGWVSSLAATLALRARGSVAGAVNGVGRRAAAAGAGTLVGEAALGAA
jgi:hypothetical protein